MFYVGIYNCFIYIWMVLSWDKIKNKKQVFNITKDKQFAINVQKLVFVLIYVYIKFNDLLLFKRHLIVF